MSQFAATARQGFGTKIPEDQARDDLQMVSDPPKGNGRDAEDSGSCDIRRRRTI